MPKRITPLSDVKVRTAKPHDTEYKIFDGGGLFLLVTPSGGKLWHFKYRFVNKERKLTFGPYPEISLADARQQRDEAGKRLAHGIDPGAVRKAQKVTGKIQAENSFEIVAREWHSRQSSAWVPGVFGVRRAVSVMG